MPTKPKLLIDEATTVLDNFYNIKTQSIKSLPSYDDLNFLITTSTSTKVVLKVFHEEFSSDENRVSEQAELQQFWFNSGIAVPQIIKTKEGLLQKKLKTKMANGKDGECYVRLLEFIEGEMLQKLPVEEQFFSEIGEAIAKCHLLMERKGSSEKFPFTSKLKHIWSIERVVNPEWEERIATLESEETTASVKAAIKDFKEILKNNCDLPSGVVHGDLNSLNIIGEKDESGKAALKAFIDFGDVCGSALVFDLSIAVLYHMVAVFTKTSSLESVYQPISWLLRGYLHSRKLTEAEINAIYYAVRARAAQSVLGAYHTLSTEPENREYLLSEAGPAEKLLNEMQNLTKEQFLLRIIPKL
ncbi:Oidioi.mRNA.OKI2018_I69.chr2.g4488.t1.cds [Oikopleura dioica]|uniref:Hydroxylysine kinase n=1 Tax=Oikopleura dioica TaxID=34765 RepID=A0ABN7T6K9_OIKDI|nr:Oidioi.mRNA.OKI2018_I69.chr2.g4488.t1.cds [Oikopleura dioica]